MELCRGWWGRGIYRLHKVITLRFVVKVCLAAFDLMIIANGGEGRRMEKAKNHKR